MRLSALFSSLARFFHTADDPSTPIILPTAQFVDDLPPFPTVNAKIGEYVVFGDVGFVSSDATTDAPVEVRSEVEAVVIGEVDYEIEAPQESQALESVEAPGLRGSPRDVIVTQSVTPRADACAAGPSSVPIFLWTEIPKSAKQDEPSLKKFYAKLLQFINGNCLQARVTRVILRMSQPDSKCGGNYMFQNHAETILYRRFLKRLPAGTDLRLYPYLGSLSGERYQQRWAAHMNEPRENFLTAVYKFTEQWNLFLESVNAPVRFNGVTLDMEEGIELNKAELEQIRQRFVTVPKFGISVGFDDVKWIYQYHKVVDEYYLQMYDFYCPGVTHMCQTHHTSPFVAHKDNHIGMSSWIEEAVIRRLKDVASLFKAKKHKSKLLLMWSTQHAGSDECLYPSGGRCGHSYDFGTWSAPDFKSFLSHVQSDLSLYSGFGGHGIYEFAYIRNEWLLPVS
jgi:hypothetical protein